MKISKKYEITLSKKFPNSDLAVLTVGSTKEIEVDDLLPLEKVVEQEQELFMEVYNSTMLDIVNLKRKVKDPIVLTIAESLSNNIKKEKSVEKSKKDLEDYV